jgi:hypothetical protein
MSYHISSLVRSGLVMTGAQDAQRRECSESRSAIEDAQRVITSEAVHQLSDWSGWLPVVEGDGIHQIRKI